MPFCSGGGVAGLPCLRTVGGFDNCVGGMALPQPWCLKWQLSCDSGGLTIFVLQLQRYHMCFSCPAIFSMVLLLMAFVPWPCVCVCSCHSTVSFVSGLRLVGTLDVSVVLASDSCTCINLFSGTARWCLRFAFSCRHKPVQVEYIQCMALPVAIALVVKAR